MSPWDVDKQHRYFKQLSKVFADSVRPSATAMILVKKIAAGTGCVKIVAMMTMSPPTSENEKIPETSLQDVLSLSKEWVETESSMLERCMKVQIESDRSFKQVSLNRSGQMRVV